MGDVAVDAKLSRTRDLSCREAIRKGSKSFYMASLILPREVREAAYALYSFCRVSDDMADEPSATLHTVTRLRERLDAAYRAEPHPYLADQALSEVVARYDIPREVVESMLEGFEWDVTGRRYETLGDLIDYAARVAGTVGVMMTIVMNRRAARTLARASDLGVAMQLTNIARDVGEDARNGRLYLPRHWMRQEGLDPDAFLDNPVFSPALGKVVKRLLEEADRIYDRSLSGLFDLPMACRPGIRAAGLVYAEIGVQVRRNGFDSINQRARTSGSKKLLLVARALASPFQTGYCDETPAMKEVMYLVHAAAQLSVETRGAGEWFLDLVAELNHRDYALTVVGSDRPDTR